MLNNESDQQRLRHNMYLEPLSEFYDNLKLHTTKRTIPAQSNFITFNDGNKSQFQIFLILNGQVVRKYKEFPTADSLIKERGMNIHSANESVGSVISGLVIGFAACGLIWLSWFDSRVEISVIIMLPFIAFWVAEEELHVSGVLSVVVAGLVAGYLGKPLLSSLAIEERIHSMWEIFSWWLNALLFAISGLILADRLLEDNLTSLDYVNGFILYLWIHVTRVISIIVQFPILHYFGYNLSFGDYTILAYGGLRGAIALALALLVDEEPTIPELVRARIVFLVSAVVFLTLMINGTTTRFVLSAFGLADVTTARLKLLNNTCGQIQHHTLNKLHSMQQNNFYK
eukprot:Pgem_evm1s1037